MIYTSFCTLFRYHFDCILCISNAALDLTIFRRLRALVWPRLHVQSNRKTETTNSFLILFCSVWVFVLSQPAEIRSRFFFRATRCFSISRATGAKKLWNLDRFDHFYWAKYKGNNWNPQFSARRRRRKIKGFFALLLCCNVKYPPYFPSSRKQGRNYYLHW